MTVTEPALRDGRFAGPGRRYRPAGERRGPLKRQCRRTMASTADRSLSASFRRPTDRRRSSPPWTSSRRAACASAATACSPNPSCRRCSTPLQRRAVCADLVDVSPREHRCPPRRHRVEWVPHLRASKESKCPGHIGQRASRAGRSRAAVRRAVSRRACARRARASEGLPVARLHVNGRRGTAVAIPIRYPCRIAEWDLETTRRRKRCGRGMRRSSRRRLRSCLLGRGSA
jgi:hypothetical protein